VSQTFTCLRAGVLRAIDRAGLRSQYLAADAAYAAVYAAQMDAITQRGRDGRRDSGSLRAIVDTHAPMIAAAKQRIDAICRAAMEGSRA
jgi:hypothetical protein